MTITPSNLSARCAAMAIAIAFSPPAHADPAPPPALPATLTLDAAIAIVERSGLDLAIADAAVAGAKGDLRAAGALHNPSIGASVGRSFAYGASCTGCAALPWQASISDDAAIADVVSGKRGLRVDVAKAALDVAKLSRRDVERTARFAVEQAYADVVLAKAARDVARKARDVASATASLIAARYSAGALGEVDVARTRTALGEAEQAVDASERDLRVAKVTLAHLLGVRTLVPDYDVDDALLRSPVPASLASATRESLLRAALENRPDLRAQRMARTRAAASVELARRQVVPDVAIGLTYAQQGAGADAVTPPTVTLGVSVPLPLFYQQQGEIERARADVDAATVQAEKAEAQIAADVEGAFAMLTASRRRVERMEAGGLLAAARQAEELTLVQYQKGAASLLEVLDAQRTFIAVHAEYLSDLDDLTTAVFRLEQAVGAEHAR